MTLRSRDLRNMSASDRDRVISEAFAASESTSRTTVITLDAKIRMYENRYNLSTDQLSAALAENRIQETAEICEWIFWSQVRARLAPTRA